MRSRTLIPVGLVAALALALVPLASAATPDRNLIRMGRGMAGISLADTQAEVKAVLGQPAKTKTGSNVFGTYTELRYKGKLRVTFQGNEDVSAISTAGEGQRTKQGIHVGSSENRLRQKVRGLACETVGGRRSCTRGKLLPGRRVTVFFIKASTRRITRITVAFVID
jgi:hypothetical protein